MNIYLIVDESGSMEPLRNDTIGGFNTFLKEQQELADAAPATLWVTCFNTARIRKSIDGVDILKVQPWSAKDYIPAAGTPLLDAVGETLSGATGEKSLVVIITDGYENSSHKWGKAAVKELIEGKIAAGWTILYFGANVDAFAEAGSLGVLAINTLQSTADAAGTHTTYTSMSSTTRSMRTEQKTPTPH